MATMLFALTREQLGIYIIVSTVAAIFGAFTTALYQDRIGTRNTIMIALALWTAIMLAAVFIREEWRDVAFIRALFWVVGGLVGFGMGMLGASSRAMVGLFSPEFKAAEFFGFYGLAHKGAAILGLAVNILAERIFAGQYNLVVASSGIFFLGGLILMWRVDERAGRIAALRADRAHHRRQILLAKMPTAESPPSR
jgi:MFS transporter, UMF1 family